MSTYAIIKLAGKQYQVQAKDDLVVDHLDQKEGSTFEIKEVMLLNEDGKVKVGTPYVKAVAKLKVVEHFKDKKIRVAKYKAKSRYRRVQGHRQHKTKVEVVSIN